MMSPTGSLYTSQMGFRPALNSSRLPRFASDFPHPKEIETLTADDLDFKAFNWMQNDDMQEPALEALSQVKTALEMQFKPIKLYVTINRLMTELAAKLKKPETVALAANLTRYADYLDKTYHDTRLAEKLYLTAMASIHTVAPTHPALINTLSNLAVFYLHHNQFDKAAEVYMDLEDLYNEQTPLPTAEKAINYCYLGNTSILKQDYPNAVHWFKESLAVLTQTPEKGKTTEATVRNFLVTTLILQGQHKEALLEGKKAITVNENTFNQSGNFLYAKTLAMLIDTCASLYKHAFFDSQKRQEYDLMGRKLSVKLSNLPKKDFYFFPPMTSSTLAGIFQQLDPKHPPH